MCSSDLRMEGVRLRSWRRTDDDGTPLAEDRRAALLAAVEGADADHLLAIVARGDFEVVPYTEDAR